ncbi:MAG: type IV pilus twitching motility protein PilT [Elusimicrobiota bacterium]|nr:type IV pilus twitching motility protein PilT [Elusimicrobiota bacterium]
MNIEELLKLMVEKRGTDLHLKAGLPPMVRISGDIEPLTAGEKLTSQKIKELISKYIGFGEDKKIQENKEFDFALELSGIARFRGALFMQKGNYGAVFRTIPMKIPTIDDLKLPAVLKEIASNKQGLVLVTGPTGSGKSTTMAAMINHINDNFKKNIITIEDPIEFVHTDNKSIINQREIGMDTHTFATALKSAMRQDPDVILVGEMRDPETITTAITSSETGHLVISTLHTNDTKQTIDRIIDSFPGEQQAQIRFQLSLFLIAVVAQRLVKKKDGSGMVAAIEIMINTPLIRSLIAETKTGQISKAIEDSASFYKTQSFNQSLLSLYKDGVITIEDALATSNNPSDLKIQIQSAEFAKKSGGTNESKIGRNF